MYFGRRWLSSRWYSERWFGRKLQQQKPQIIPGLGVRDKVVNGTAHGVELVISIIGLEGAVSAGSTVQPDGLAVIGISLLSGSAGLAPIMIPGKAFGEVNDLTEEELFILLEAA